MKRRSLIPIALAVFVLVSSCGDSASGPSPETAAVAEVVLGTSALSLLPAQTAQLEVTLRDDRGRALNGRTVAWSTSDGTVATVTQAGLVTALEPGDATITATSEGVQGAASVEVSEVPVADVVLDRTDAAELVPGQTLQLAATARDSVGGALEDRPAIWSSADEQVAIVDDDGLVEGVGPGETTVAAEVEGRTASLDVVVEDGGVVGSGDTEIVAADGSVRIFVPQGAAEPGTVITVEPVESAPDLPASHTGTTATAYRFGPDGMSFDAPVRVTLSFGADDLPEWADPTGLAMHRWDGTQWHALGSVEVDAGDGTVTASTSGFSDFELTLPLPNVTLSPDPGQVNELQRSVTLTTTLTGPGLASGEDFSAFSFSWATPGTNGTLIDFTGNQATYSATIPIIPEGTVDQVTVRVTGLAADRETVIPIGERTVDIRGDLVTSIRLTPFREEIDFGQETTFEAIVTPLPSVTSDLRYFWQYTDNHGTWNLENAQRSESSTITFEAWDAEMSTPAPPRIDQLDLRVILLVRNAEGDVVDERDLGTAQSFVEIAGEKLFGSWGTEINGICAEAYIYVPKVVGATSYEMHAHGFNDTAYWGTEIRRSWGASGGGGIIDGGDQWKFGLSGACGADPESALPWFEERFSGMEVDVIVR